MPGEGYGAERPMVRSAIITSRDGIRWTLRHTGDSQELTDVAFGDNRFVAIGNNEGPTNELGNSQSRNAVVLTSSDGTAWTATDVGGRQVAHREGWWYDSSDDNPSVRMSSIAYLAGTQEQ